MVLWEMRQKKETNKKWIVKILAVFLAVFMLPIKPVQAKSAAIYLATRDQIPIKKMTVPKGSSIYLELASKDYQVQEKLWQSFNKIKITVKNKKIVSKNLVAKKVGKTDIVFTYKKKKYTCKITVVPKHNLELVSAEYDEEQGEILTVKNNMKKEITFYTEEAFGHWQYQEDGAENGSNLVTFSEKEITVKPGETGTLIAAEGVGLQLGDQYENDICIKAEYDGQKCMYQFSDGYDSEYLLKWYCGTWINFSDL